MGTADLMMPQARFVSSPVGFVRKNGTVFKDRATGAYHALFGGKRIVK